MADKISTVSPAREQVEPLAPNSVFQSSTVNDPRGTLTTVSSKVSNFSDRVRRVYQYRHFLRSLVSKEFKIRYAQSFLGFLWMILEPLMLVGTLSTVFVLMGRGEREGAPFPIFFYSGILPWNLFRAALVDGCKSFIKDQGLLSKINYPREISILKDLAIFLVEFFVASLAFLVVLVIYRWVPNTNWLYLPVLLGLQLFLCLGIMFLTATLTVYIRDVGILMKTFGTLWFWFTPVVLDFQYNKTTAPIFILNPMVGIIKGYRSIIIYGSAPDWHLLIPAVVASVIFLISGYSVFRRLERTFVDVL